MLSLFFCLGLYFAPTAVMTQLRTGHATATVPWQAIAAQKRQRDMAKIPPEWRLPQDVLDQPSCAGTLPTSSSTRS